MQQKEQPARNDRIRQDHRIGKSYTELSREHGIGRSRVATICRSKPSKQAAPHQQVRQTR